jgi:hypothetical protein
VEEKEEKEEKEEEEEEHHREREIIQASPESYHFFYESAFR